MLYLLLLTAKHFLADAPLQNEYQYLNKGNWKHLGGYLHAGIHGLFTLVISLFFVPVDIAILISLLDTLIHYVVDWLKINATAKYKWSGINEERKCLEIYSNWYFYALILDQCAHFATYILLYSIVLGV